MSGCIPSAPSWLPVLVVLVIALGSDVPPSTASEVFDLGPPSETRLRSVWLRVCGAQYTVTVCSPFRYLSRRRLEQRSGFVGDRSVSSGKEGKEGEKEGKAGRRPSWSAKVASCSLWDCTRSSREEYTSRWRCRQRLCGLLSLKVTSSSPCGFFEPSALREHEGRDHAKFACAPRMAGGGYLQGMAV